MSCNCRKFRAVPQALPPSVPRETAESLEPIRDLVRTRFQSENRLDRVPTFAQLIALGLIRSEDVLRLQD